MLQILFAVFEDLQELRETSDMKVCAEFTQAVNFSLFHPSPPCISLLLLLLFLFLLLLLWFGGSGGGGSGLHYSRLYVLLVVCPPTTNHPIYFYHAFA